MLKINGNAKVSKIEDKSSYVKSCLTTSRKVKEEWKTSFFDTVFVGKGCLELAQTLGDKAKIKILDIGLTNEPYEKKTGEKVWNNPKLAVFNFEILENPNVMSASPVSDDDDYMPF